MSQSTIKRCVCKHDYQDKKYGKNRRVMVGNASNTYRCTVCDRKYGEKEEAKD